ncbi:glycosyl transferase, group 2 family protein, partial [mine drainage metagenome]
MESKPSSSLVSVIITVRDEEPNLARLLESLLQQEPPFEVLIVDAQSRDRTFAIASEFAERYPGIFFAWQRFGSRGQGRNSAAARARGEGLAFIDGDCIADSAWLSRIRQGLGRSAVVAGRTVPVGSSAFGELDRVELYQAGSDVSY